MFEASLEDVSRADVPSDVIAVTRLTSPGNPPIAFGIVYDPARIVANHRYVVRARILLDGRLLFTSDAVYPVLTQGHPSTVSMILRRVGGNETASPGGQGQGLPPTGAPPLEKTFWRATELGSQRVTAANAAREPHLVIEEGGRVGGSDGCNRVTGTYERTGEAITFGRMAATDGLP